MGLPLITLRATTKHYGATVALRGVDLDVAPHEAVVILGPNGAGKTTLLRILGTTVLADGGTAEVAGFDPATQPLEVRRRIGLVLGDERAFYWRLTGRANLEFFARLHGLPAPAASRRATEALALFDLDEVADRRVDRYSSGMRIRLGLARALLGHPSVLLLDEPTRSLDPVAAESTRRVVRDLADRGLAVLFATHNLHEAAQVGDRVVVLSRGEVVASADRGASASDLEEVLLSTAP